MCPDYIIFFSESRLFRLVLGLNCICLIRHIVIWANALRISKDDWSYNTWGFQNNSFLRHYYCFLLRTEVYWKGYWLKDCCCVWRIFGVNSCAGTMSMRISLKFNCWPKSLKANFINSCNIVTFLNNTISLFKRLCLKKRLIIPKPCIMSANDKALLPF